MGFRPSFATRTPVCVGFAEGDKLKMINHSEAVYVIRRRRNVIATQVAYVINTKDYIYTPSEMPYAFGDYIHAEA